MGMIHTVTTICCAYIYKLTSPSGISANQRSLSPSQYSALSDSCTNSDHRTCTNLSMGGRSDSHFRFPGISIMIPIEKKGSSAEQ
jgi:hypothetical protein